MTVRPSPRPSDVKAIPTVDQFSDSYSTVQLIHTFSSFLPHLPRNFGAVALNTSRRLLNSDVRYVDNPIPRDRQTQGRQLRNDGPSLTARQLRIAHRFVDGQRYVPMWKPSQQKDFCQATFLVVFGLLMQCYWKGSVQPTEQRQLTRPIYVMVRHHASMPHEINVKYKKENTCGVDYVSRDRINCGAAFWSFSSLRWTLRVHGIPEK